MRVFIQSLLVFGLSLIIGHFGLPFIRNRSRGQQVRDEGPKSHLSKSGTPTFGGFFFLIPLFVVFILRFIVEQGLDDFNFILLLVFAYAAVGFADDYKKVKINKDGLSVVQKILFLGIITCVFAFYFVYIRSHEVFIIIPFSGNKIFIEGFWKIVYSLFIILYIFFMANAVNIADGVDGLCSSISVVSTLCLALTLYIHSGTEHLPLIELCLSIAAGVLSFLIFNWHPAKIFMGDTGSLALGAGIAGIALVAGIPWIMLLNGLVFIIEGLSSLLQTAYYKLTNGKRIFRMAPLHHHFELGGWSEKKVVIIFAFVGLVGGLVGLLLLV